MFESVNKNYINNIKETYIFFQKEHIKLVKSDISNFLIVTKKLYFKLILFFSTFYSPKNPEKNV